MHSSAGERLRAVVCVGMMGLTISLAGCGPSEEGVDSEPGDAGGATEVAAASSTLPATGAQTSGWAPVGAEIRDAFENACLEVEEEIPIFIPAELPRGAVLGADGEARLGGAAARAVVSVDVAGGRVEFLQGVEGDVGDLPGSIVGDVEGASARRYDVLGGTLVQWGVDGVWYGVFGVGVEGDVVVQIALGARRL